jgi:hypothetical protein
MDPVILQAMEQTYGSVTAPNFTKLSQRLDERPCDGLIEVIGYKFALTVTTDGNYDHTFRLFLQKGARHWSLELSAVARSRCWPAWAPVAGTRC